MSDYSIDILIPLQKPSVLKSADSRAKSPLCPLINLWIDLGHYLERGQVPFDQLLWQVPANKKETYRFVGVSANQPTGSRS